MLSGESDAGSGKVDFSLGTGYNSKVLVELKKNKHSDIISGFEKQITTYEHSEKAQHSFYVVIIVEPEDLTKKKSSKLKKLKETYESRLRQGLKSPELVIIDGLVYESASKRK
jgi:DNA replication protein DnaC